MRCVTACPTKALLGDGRMNAQRCLSYQTQTKGMMPEEYRKKCEMSFMDVISAS
ncbi:4Fe-4S double cluster binding domain-containing protein [Enterococcus faecium]